MENITKSTKISISKEDLEILEKYLKSEKRNFMYFVNEAVQEKIAKLKKLK